MLEPLLAFWAGGAAAVLAFLLGYRASEYGWAEGAWSVTLSVLGLLAAAVAWPLFVAALLIMAFRSGGRP